MKTFTNEQTKDIFEKAWEAGTSGWGSAEFEVVENTPELVKVRVFRSYESPGLSFAALAKLAEVFETKNINDDDNFSSSGCETCDYGSEYGFYLSIRPEGVKP